MKKVLLGLMTATIVFTACEKDDDDNNGNTLNQQDRDFMMMAAYGNNAEIAAGQMAAQKGMNLSVRSYGQMMVSDHTVAQAELDSIADLLDVNLPQGLDSAHQALAAQLAAATGYTFDSLYINSQLMDHQVMMNLMQTEINNGSHQSARGYAQKYLPKIEMHHHMADSIKNDL